MSGNWLNKYFSAVVRYLGVNLPMRGIIEVIGDDVEASDETLEDGTKVTRLTFGSGGGASVDLGSGTEIDWSQGSVFYKSMPSGETTFTFDNATDGRRISVALTPGMGTATVVWPTVTWSGDAPPDEISGTVVYNFVATESVIYGSTGSGGGATPGGSDGQVQYKDGSALGGDAGLAINETSHRPVMANGLELTDGAFTMVVDGTPTAARTVTLPDATDTLVGKATTDTLTNKTINGSNNTITNVSLSTGVTGTLPGANMQAASTAGAGNAGSMSSADKAKLDGIQTQGASRNLNAGAGTLDIDWSLSSTFTKTLAAGGNTFTFSNATDGQVIVVALTSDAGGITVSWTDPSGVTIKWAGGAAPTQTSTGIDVYTFVRMGSTIYGSVVQDMS